MTGPRTVSELEALLATPTDGTVDLFRDLDGDLLILGAGGKMGPSLARLAAASREAAGTGQRVVCVSRFGNPDVVAGLEASGIETISCDLLDREALNALPDIPNIVFLAGMKFGSSAALADTWALNCYLPAVVGERFNDARLTILSTGNVYPFTSVESGGATEATPPAPIGEYAQSCLGRERMFEYMAATHGSRLVIVRLNYATDLRYGVLLDIATKVHHGAPIDVAMGWFNTIWQRDANSAILQSLRVASSEPTLVNLTGPETLSVRETATTFARLLGAPAPQFVGSEAETALLSNASYCESLFGPPAVSASELISWTAAWVAQDGPTLSKPTKFEVRDGTF